MAIPARSVGYTVWSSDDGGLGRYFYSDSRGRLHKCYAMCRRCKHDFPQGRVLWRWLRLQLRVSYMAKYLYRLAHAPKYLNRLKGEMRVAMEWAA